VETETEVSSEESMNQPDSLEEKLMCKRACDTDDGDTSSTESEHNFVGTPVDPICSDADDSNDDGVSDF
jgi:hypothetical protein